mmetsp:Transcript_45544/g.91943  ORF Transcript_45544/g.91943 Transcript_45544/m.91943 type:complete len:208 (-) Transcript_45544:222-845(-)
MNESVDLMPFGGPLIGRKRRALAALCLLTRSGSALVLGATLILEPKTVLVEFGYNQGVAVKESDVLIEQLLGVWMCAWALFSIYTIGFGSVQDKKACAVTNAVATLVCVGVASSTPGVGGARDLSKLYLELAALILTTDGLTFFLCGAGPRMVRINSNTWLRMNADEDTYKDPMLAGGSSGETTTMKRINSHTQLFTREAGTEKKRE